MARNSITENRMKETADGMPMTNADILFTPEKGKVMPEITASSPAVTLPRKKPIGEEDIKRAEALLNTYRQESQALRLRIIENEKYYEFTATSGRSRCMAGCDSFVKSHSAYLFNTIANKHADFMDNMPSPTILPQEESDEETAKLLSDVVPSIFAQNHFTEIYSDACFDKLVEGAALYSVIWDGSAENGLGQIKINNAELLNLYWKGGISDLEDSPNLFYVSVENNADLLIRYPQLEGHVGNGTVLNMEEYVYEDTPHREDVSLVVDWYYRKPTLQINATDQRVVKNILHYCIFCNGVVLFASENEVDPDTGMPAYPNGFYEHGQYPYLMDKMFRIKGSPAGFGYVDVVKNPQEYIDELDSAILENALQKASPRYMVPIGAGINKDDLADHRKKVIEVTGLTDQCKPIETPELNGNVLSVRQMKVDELKETSGNTDFSQGTTSGGVTAASAIAALQEASSKLSRSMLKLSYATYSKICVLIIELMRQFYTTDRVFRITQENGDYSFQTFSANQLKADPESSNFGISIGGRKPYFDIKVDAQKASPFSRLAQNELAKELYGAGFFNPDIADQTLIAMKMMEFEGKDKVISQVSENQTLLQENQMLKSNIVQLANVLAMSGDENSAAMAQAIAQKYGSMDGQQPQLNMAAGRNVEINSLGAEQATNTIADKAKKQAQDRTNVR